jgi:hypothetical protein
LAIAFIALLIIGVFIYDFTSRWWRQREWKRRWSRRDQDDD